MHVCVSVCVYMIVYSVIYSVYPGRRCAGTEWVKHVRE